MIALTIATGTVSTVHVGGLKAGVLGQVAEDGRHRLHGHLVGVREAGKTEIGNIAIVEVNRAVENGLTISSLVTGNAENG